MKKILIAPNSFKGSANSVKVAEYFYKYLARMGDDIYLTVLPISDGGDGFLEVCENLFGLERRLYSITTPYDNSIMKTSVGYDRKNSIVYIESAKVLGLSVIPKSKQRAIELTSKGLGELIVQLAKENELGVIKIRKAVFGIGGTGTNDMGIGMCSRLGLKLQDHYGNMLNSIPEEFHKAGKIIWEPIQLPFEIECIVDVGNELLGKSGATYAFASQKGATKGELAVMELGISKILNLLYQNKLTERPEKLFGAGGGLAAGLQIFLGAEIVTAKDFLFNRQFKDKISQKFDAIVTGEGSFDKQSEWGKGAYLLINFFKDSTDKIFLCAGNISDDIISKFPSNLIPIQLKDFFTSAEESIQNIEIGIKKASQIIINQINS